MSAAVYTQPSVGRIARRAALVAIAAIVAAPIVATIVGADFDLSEILAGRGREYVLGTVLLCALVALGAGVIGACAAAAVCLAEFPGRRILAVLLAMPFAVPAYVSAYAYGDFLGPLGPVAQLIGLGALPEIRTLPGAAFILTLAAYPYVYLAMAASLSARSGAYLEAARLLGAGPVRASLTVAVAAGRPALAGGLALALMETAADYGVADFFGVPTLSVGIFRTWYGLGDLAAATQLAAVLFLAALIFVLLEESGRRGRAADDARLARRPTRLSLSPVASAIVVIFLAAPVVLGFIIPAGVLAAQMEFSLGDIANRGLLRALANTALVAALGAVIALIIAVMLAYAARQIKKGAPALMLRISTLGYAVPGAVIAIGLVALTARLPGAIGATTAGGVAILLYAYVARFLTAGYNAAAGGLAQISPQMDAAARMQGASGFLILREIHWPQARAAIMAGGAIIAIDIAKELPATLLLRPFNFETLATHVYRLASDERLSDAAPAALILIAFSLIPVLMISRSAFSQGPARRRDKQSADRPGTDPGSARATPIGGFQDPVEPPQ